MESNDSNILYAPYIMAETIPLIINGLEVEEWDELKIHDVMNGGDGEQFDISWLNKNSNKNQLINYENLYGSTNING